MELFNASCEQETSTGQVKEATLDVHLELLAFYTFAIKHFRRDDMFGPSYPFLWCSAPGTMTVVNLAAQI